VTWSPWLGACGAADCGGAAEAPSAGFDSIVTMFDMIAFFIPEGDGL
jgi:hypothetical protein